MPISPTASTPVAIPYTPPFSRTLNQKKTPTYSPNSLFTLRSTLSFSGSYGWSLDGISKTAGNAAVYVSTL